MCQQDLRDGVPNCHSAPAKAVGTLPVSQTLPCTLLLSTLQIVARREDFGVIETQGPHISKVDHALFLAPSTPPAQAARGAISAGVAWISAKQRGPLCQPGRSRQDAAARRLAGLYRRKALGGLRWSTAYG